jgi:RNA polymerase sigma factor (sigma-70 family)
MSAQRIGLGALSARQGRLVERHLPLVWYTIKRLGHLARRRRLAREPEELFQEGTLALIEAVRTHDPARHGRFAAFAMARIHFCVSRFVRERAPFIRVPMITQRRRLARGLSNDGWGPPQCVRRLRDGSKIALRCRAASPEDMAESAPADSMTIGDLLRRRHDVAMERVASELRRAAGRRTELRRLIRRLRAERWTIPDPDSKTPLRKLAEELGCSAGRVVRCDERYRRKMSALLEADEQLRALTALARRRPLGLRHGLSAHEIRRLASRHSPDRRKRAEPPEA